MAMAASAAAVGAIIALRYVLSSGAFALLTWVRHPGLYAGLDGQIRREIGWSLASAAIYGIPAGIMAWGWRERDWTQIYSAFDAWPVWYWPLSILIYLAAHDSWFYWTHRLMHRPPWFRAVHAVHHASGPPTAWAAMSFHPWEALTGAIVIPARVLIVPIHVGALGVVLTIMTIMGVANHVGWEIFPRALVQGVAGRWLITASHHQKHHENYRGNFGLYFRCWDRLCGTDLGIAPCGSAELLQTAKHYDRR